MDPISQGILGATWATSSARKKELLPAFWLGLLSGLAADLDVLIRSNKDPLFALEFHRHFTHSLAFIPFGALICSLVLYPFARKHLASFKRVYFYCFFGFASHGFLDACTSYGTQLLWPFSNIRVAWDIISIIDPLFTLPLIAFMILLRLKRSQKWAWTALAYSFVYLGIGWVQRDRAIAETRVLAAQRGHEPLRVQAKPSIANLILFRGIYETEDRFFVDAIRVPFLGKAQHYNGGSLPKTTEQELRAPKNSALEKDIQRFTWFSDNFVVWHPSYANVLGDFRYSLLPISVEPLWGIVVDQERPETHSDFLNFRNIQDGDLQRLLNMLRGRDVEDRVSP
jgi:inner membrane protein